MLTIALSKGRILTETLPLLAKLGVVPQDDPDSSRKLILTTNNPDINIIIVRATDVPTYVEYGAADMFFFFHCVSFLVGDSFDFRT